MTKVTHLGTQRLVAELRWLLWCHIGCNDNLRVTSVSIFISFRAAAGRGPHFSPFRLVCVRFLSADLSTVPVGYLPAGCSGLAPVGPSQLVPDTSLEMFPACSTQLVSGRVPATGRLPSAGCRSVPISWLPGGSACHISYRCLSAACNLVALDWFPPCCLSVLAPGRLPSTILMSACSLHAFRLAHITFISAGLPQQIAIIPVLVHIGSASLS